MVLAAVVKNKYADQSQLLCDYRQCLSASIPPFIRMLVEDLRVSSAKASQLTSWAVLGVGFGVWR